MLDYIKFRLQLTVQLSLLTISSVQLQIVLQSPRAVTFENKIMPLQRTVKRLNKLPLMLTNSSVC